MSSRWSHVICIDCFKKKRGEEVEPYRVNPAGGEIPTGRCCFCAQGTIADIFYRANPDECLVPENHVEES